MRHRIGGGITGIGSSVPCRLTNNIKLPDELKEFADEMISQFHAMWNYNGFDIQLDNNGVYFGIEPSYKFDPLEILYFNFKSKDCCSYIRGVAYGFYGADVVTKSKNYVDYKYKTKFVRFVDKWYDKVRGELCKDT